MMQVDPNQRAASSSPPAGLTPNQVPMFVNLGFDDNAYSGLDGSGGTGGMSWAIEMMQGRTNPWGAGQSETFDGTPATASFYMTSTYIGTWVSESPSYVKRAWRTAVEAGHEIGNHTHSHSHGSNFTDTEWQDELQACMDWMVKPYNSNEPNHSPDDTAGIGVPASEIYGFRTPFLEYNESALTIIENLGLEYDCSIEEGWQPTQDGTDYNWPYTLDQGSPGNEVLVDWGLKDPISNHPGLWEMPVYPLIVPPDDRCAEYGVPTGMRAKMKGIATWFDEGSGKITGFDYNLWVSFRMNKAEFLATLKYSFDQRLEGNRAPFMFGTHSDYYSSKYTGAPNATVRERQEAIEEFLDYVATKPEVRIVSTKQILDWVRQPVPLN